MNRLTPSFDVFDDNLRMKRLNGLRHRLCLAALEDTVQSEPDAPSLGIEVELTWDQAIPELREKWLGNPIRPSTLHTQSSEYKEFKQLYDRGDKTARQKYRQIKDIVPQVQNAHDSYHEFSFYPSRNMSVIVSELTTLYDMGILDEGIEYATHVTAAGINSNYDAISLLCLMEINGGTTARRLRAPLIKRNSSWAQKDVSGILKRTPEELLGDANNAYEFRSLVTTGPDQIATVLEIAQNAIIDQKNDRQKWLLQQQAIKNAFEAAGLPWTSWENPRNQPLIWRHYANSSLIPQ